MFGAALLIAFRALATRTLAGRALTILTLATALLALCAVSGAPAPAGSAPRGSASGGPAFLPLTPPEAEGESALPPGIPGIPGLLESLLGSDASPDASPLPSPLPSPPPPVSLPPAPPVRNTEAREREMLRRGIVPVELRPAKPMLLSAPFPGVLASVRVHDGEAVSKDDVIAVFDVAAAEKGIEDARAALSTAIAAVQHAGDAPEREREKAREALARNADRLAEAEDKLVRSTLTAPFDGRVTEVRAKAGQHLRRGDVVAELAGAGDLEIVCTVPSLWINRLRPGHIIWVYVEERDKSYEAEFVRFGGKVDAATKSIRAYSRFLAAPDELLPGMSGRADFFPRPQQTE